MNDTSMQVVPPGFQLEFETLRDQRDLYRSLLLSEAGPLGTGMVQGLASAQQIQSLLRAPTRDGPAFRGKIEQLLAELATLEEALLGLHLPTVAARLQSAQRALREIELREEITGNDLLPAMVLLGELCSHITIAADCAAVHVPMIEDERAEAEPERRVERRAQPRLVAALQQLTERLAREHGKAVTLHTLGLEHIPESWVSALFDLLAQLLRNAIEHGIEAPAQRLAQAKSEQGTLLVEFVARADHFELMMQDDGRGLDAGGIAHSAVTKGLLSTQAAQRLDDGRLVSLIFQPGVSTALDAARRGQGMKIVSERVRRLGGRIQASTKPDCFTRFRVELPALAMNAPQLSVGA